MPNLDTQDPQKLVRNLTNQVSILFNPQADIVLALIRAHLYTEYLIEQIIIKKLPKGERITKGSRFSYSQKLIIISSLGVVEDEIIASLRELNKIRNDCAHELHYDITEEHLSQLRVPLVKHKKRLEKTDKVFDLKLKLGSTIVFLCGHLTAVVYFTE